MRLTALLFVFVFSGVAVACGSSDAASPDAAGGAEITEDVVTPTPTPTTTPTPTVESSVPADPPQFDPACPPDRGAPTASLGVSGTEEADTYRLDISIVNLGMAAVELRTGSDLDGRSIAQYLNGELTVMSPAPPGIEVVSFEGAGSEYSAVVRITDAGVHDITAYVRGEAGFVFEFESGCDYVWSWSSASSPSVHIAE